MTVYLIALASEEGAFALSISPVDKGADPLVEKIANSFRLVHRKLDAEEVKRLSTSEIGSRQ